MATHGVLACCNSIACGGCWCVCTTRLCIGTTIDSGNIASSPTEQEQQTHFASESEQQFCDTFENQVNCRRCCTRTQRQQQTVARRLVQTLDEQWLDSIARSECIVDTCCCVATTTTTTTQQFCISTRDLYSTIVTTPCPIPRRNTGPIACAHRCASSESCSTHCRDRKTKTTRTRTMDANIVFTESDCCNWRCIKCRHIAAFGDCHCYTSVSPRRRCRGMQIQQ